MTSDAGPLVPVTVLTGFLGAGKTTLLNALLREPAMAGAAVIVNEFGEIGVDHLLVDRIDGDMLMLTTGCLCCAARGDLVTALAKLLDRRRRCQVAFDRIVIETSGLADPGPVLNALLPNPELGTACRLDRLVTVVDAVSGTEVARTSHEAARQIALADLLVLSKTDLLRPDDRGSLAVLDKALRAINLSAPLLHALDPASVVAAMGMPGLAFRRGPHPHAHGHLAGIEAVSLRAGRIDTSRFERFLDRLLARHGADLLRLKGFMATRSDPDRPIVVNVVQHRIHPASRLERWPDDDRNTRLVVIARKGIVAEIAALWDAFFGPPRIDQADAAAFATSLDNPPGLF